MHKLFSSFLFCSLMAPSVWALGVREPSQDARATARGEAFVATADNPAAIYYNPAGITQLQGDQVSVGAYIISLKSEYTSPAGATAETDNDAQIAPHFYYTHQFSDKRFTAGIGFYTPYGLSNEYKDDAPFRTLARKGSIQYLSFSPVIAAKITSTFSLAAGFVYSHATAELSQGIFAPGDATTLKGDDGATSFKLGALWQPTPQHSFGISYQAETRMKFSGDLENRPYTPREDATADFTFPQFLIVGYSFRPTPEWNFEFNYDWTDWNALNDVTIRTESGATTRIPFQWKNSAFYEFGATRYFKKGWSASVGYIYSENSVPETHFTPLVPDSERHIFSAGFGYKSNAWNINFAYQYAHGPERTISNSASTSLIGESANGSYEFNSHAISLDVGLAFEARLLPASQGPKRGTLLIVDDEEGPRQSLKIVFKGEYHILIAKSGEEAIDLLKENSQIDVVISDIRMTGISGIELLAVLKHIDQDVQVIMLTAYETIETARSALRLGACDYLNKPFDIPAIRSSVAGALEKKLIARQLRNSTEQLGGLQQQIQNERIETSMHRTQGEIYASVIHDINNPLTIISCFSEMINMCIGQLNQIEGENLASLRTHMSQITAQVSKCHDISHRYLGFLRKQKDERSSVNVRQIFNDLRDLLRSHREAQGHSLFIKDIDEDIFAEMNGTDLVQVLLNLIINAFQSATGTSVNVVAQKLKFPLDFGVFRETSTRRFINRDEFANTAPLIEIVVSDNGPGIPEEILPRIFETFFTTKPVGKGTGIGLGIVERLIRKAGGVLHVDSMVGRGTLFTIYLPGVPDVAA